MFSVVALRNLVICLKKRCISYCAHKNHNLDPNNKTTLRQLYCTDISQPNHVHRTFSSLRNNWLFQDRSSHAIPTLEGQDSILDGTYTARKDAIEKCYQAAKKRGFHVFAVEDGGWCAASSWAAKTFDKYGKSSNCRLDGEGGPGANQVYIIKGKRTFSRISYSIWPQNKAYFMQNYGREKE